MTKLNAISTTGVIDENGNLHDVPRLDGLKVGPVRIVIIVEESEYDLSDIQEKDWRHAMQSTSALEFLRHPEEDIYTSEDGETFKLLGMKNYHYEYVPAGGQLRQSRS